MGLIERAFTLFLGGGGNVLRDTVEVFRENAEGRAKRAATIRGAALEQFAAEFAAPRQGIFDRLLDGLNRLPGPRSHWGRSHFSSRRWWIRCASRPG